MVNTAAHVAGPLAPAPPRPREESVNKFQRPSLALLVKASISGEHYLEQLDLNIINLI